MVAAGTPLRLVLASNNAKKLSEMQALFAALPLQLVPQGALGIPEAEEPHHTFIENALVKARQAARLSGGAAMADDSGLCVDALGGAPGVISAHYAGEVAVEGEREQRRAVQDAANNQRVLAELAARTAPGERRAAFLCTLVAIRHADDPEPLVAVGRWPGELLTAPRGTQGFGYDPLMFITELGRTVAELDAATKNQHSHRSRAAARMVALMQEAWHLG
jgi:XTP/dITP diphosphohydrolase